VKVGTRVVVLPGSLPATAAVAPVDSPRKIVAVTPFGVTSASDMPRKRHKPEGITAKLRQVDALVSQGQSIADATREIGVTEETYYRWRQEVGRLKRNEVKRPKDRDAEAPKAPEVSADRQNAYQTNSTAETTAFEE
jgi:putative transposase